MLFDWNENLKVGVSAIDNDHREIIELINEASAIASGSRSQIAVLERLYKLGYVFHRHFLKEQALMAVSGYTGYAEHRKQHDEFLEAYRSMIEQSGGGRQRTDGAISFALNRRSPLLRQNACASICHRDREYEDLSLTTGRSA